MGAKKKEVEPVKRDTSCINDPLDILMHDAIEYVYGHIPDDGLAQLVAKYPKRCKEVYAALDNDWSEKGIQQWKASMEKGLRKIDVWIEEKQLTLV